jgi:hypothetical protein
MLPSRSAFRQIQPSPTGSVRPADRWLMNRCGLMLSGHMAVSVVDIGAEPDRYVAMTQATQQLVILAVAD